MITTQTICEKMDTSRDPQPYDGTDDCWMYSDTEFEEPMDTSEPPQQYGGQQDVEMESVEEPMDTSEPPQQYDASEEPQPYDGSDDIWMYSPNEYPEYEILTDFGFEDQQQGGAISNIVSNNDISEDSEHQMRWILVEDNGEIRHERFKRIAKRAVFRVEHNFKDFKDLHSYEEKIDNAFESAVLPMLHNASPDDLFSASVEHESLTPSIYMGFQKVRNFDKKAFLNKLYAIAQSNTAFLLDGSLIVKVSIIRPIVAAGWRKGSIKTYDDMKFKRSIFTVKNQNKACGYIAIAVGIKFHEWNVASDYNQRRWINLRDYGPNQERLGEEFCNAYNFPVNEELTIGMIADRVQPAIAHEYQIIVINFPNGTQLFIGPDREKVIYLCYYEERNHFNLIKSMTGFRQRSFYCKKCNKAFEHITSHNCGFACKKYREMEVCEDEGITRFCDLCNKTFNSEKCYDQHIKNKCCSEEKFCRKCDLKYNLNYKHEHKCGEYRCTDCSQYYEQQPHYCFMKPLNAAQLKKDDELPKIIVAFDIESMLIKNNNKIRTQTNLHFMDYYL